MKITTALLAILILVVRRSGNGRIDIILSHSDMLILFFMGRIMYWLGCLCRSRLRRDNMFFMGFIVGIITMWVVWFISDYHSPQYKQGYIDGVKDGIMKAVNEVVKEVE